MFMIDETSKFLIENGIEPFIGGFIGGFVAGAISILFIKSLFKENVIYKSPLDFKTINSNSYPQKSFFDSRISIKINSNGSEQSLNSNESEAVISLINSGNKMEAINYLREKFNMGLNESKELVDILEKQYSK